MQHPTMFTNEGEAHERYGVRLCVECRFVRENWYGRFMCGHPYNAHPVSGVPRYSCRRERQLQGAGRCDLFEAPLRDPVDLAHESQPATRDPVGMIRRLIGAY